VLCGILFVLYTGIPRRLPPRELRFGFEMTFWRRLCPGFGLDYDFRRLPGSHRPAGMGSAHLA